MAATMRPSDLNPRPFYVCDSSGAPVTGLVTGSFTYRAIRTPPGGSPAAWTHSTTVVEIGSGWYVAIPTMPSMACNWLYQVIHATHIVTPFAWEDELEAWDRDAIASLIAKPIVRVQGQGTVGQPVALDPIYAYRKAVIVIGVVDADGDPAPLTTDYASGSWKVGFRSQTTQSGAAPRLDAVDGTPAGFGLLIADGSIIITIPDDLSIFGAMTEGASPTDQMTIDMEVTAEQPAGQTCSVVAPSALTIKKRAEGSGAP